MCYLARMMHMVPEFVPWQRPFLSWDGGIERRQLLL